MKTAKFITVEGIEGAGKSTNIVFIQAYLVSRGIDLLVTREPGGTPLSEDIRQLLLQERVEGIDTMAELLLVFAARAQHIKTVILPALERGQWVLCDRFTDATYAYQGGGRGIPMQTIAALESLVQNNLHPDLTLVLDIDIDVGLTRVGKRGAMDRFEAESRHFFESVRRCYLQRAVENNKSCQVIDANLSLAEVQVQIQTVLDQYFYRHFT